MPGGPIWHSSGHLHIRARQEAATPSFGILEQSPPGFYLVKSLSEVMFDGALWEKSRWLGRWACRLGRSPRPGLKPREVGGLASSLL